METSIPSPQEAAWYQQTVNDRDEKSLLLVHRERPDILWRNLFKTFTPDDLTWISGVFAARDKAERNRMVEDDASDRFPDEGHEGHEAQYEP
jgi:hypothetical protein